MRRVLLVLALVGAGFVGLPRQAAADPLGIHPTFIFGVVPQKVCLGKPTRVAFLTLSANEPEWFTMVFDFNTWPGPHSQDQNMWVEHGALTRTAELGTHTWTQTGTYEWRVAALNLYDGGYGYGTPWDSGWVEVVQCDTYKVPPRLAWGGDDSETTPGSVELTFERKMWDSYEAVVKWGDGAENRIHVPGYNPHYESPTYIVRLDHKYENTGSRYEDGYGGYYYFQTYYPMVYTNDSYGWDGGVVMIDQAISHHCPAPGMY